MKIAITGGIGTGKSTFIKALELYLPHYTFHSVDQGVHQLYAHHPNVQQDLYNLFGTTDRSSISNIAFANKALLTQLEDLLEPYLSEMIEGWLLEDDVVVEFPLLFEKQYEDYFDVIIAIVADDDVRIKRVQERNGFTVEKIESIMRQQKSKHFFAQPLVADYIIDTTHNPDIDLRAKMIALDIEGRKTGVVAGSFDPITEGHLWLIAKALDVVDHINIVVAQNPAKKGLFDLEQRAALVVESLREKRVPSQFWTVSVLPREKLLINYAQEIGASFVFRGIRNVTDFDYESQINLVQKKVVPSIETIFLMPPQHLTEVSSSLVKSLIGLEGWENVVEQYVSNAVLSGLKQKA